MVQQSYALQQSHESSGNRRELPLDIYDNCEGYTYSWCLMNTKQPPMMPVF
jgi:hypothetical protein